MELNYFLEFKLFGSQNHDKFIVHFMMIYTHVGTEQDSKKDQSNQRMS